MGYRYTLALNFPVKKETHLHYIRHIRKKSHLRDHETVSDLT